MIAITFALPHESRDFVRRLENVRRPRGSGLVLGKLGSHEIVVLFTGVGTEAAAKATREFLAHHRPQMLISTGYAGALDPALAIGAIVVATNFPGGLLLPTYRSLDASAAGSGGEFCAAEQFVHGPLTTQPNAAETPAQKAELARATGAIAVDMESAVIAVECARSAVPLLVLRAISDRAADSLPVPLDRCYDLTRQRPRPLALVLFLLLHPSRIGPFIRFLRDLTEARRALASALVEVIKKSAHD